MGESFSFSFLLSSLLLSFAGKLHEKLGTYKIFYNFLCVYVVSHPVECVQSEDKRGRKSKDVKQCIFCVMSNGLGVLFPRCRPCLLFSNLPFLGRYALKYLCPTS